MHECDHSNCDLFDSAQITQLWYPFGALGGCPHEAQQNFLMLHQGHPDILQNVGHVVGVCGCNWWWNSEMVTSSGLLKVKQVAKAPWQPWDGQEKMQNKIKSALCVFLHRLSCVPFYDRANSIKIYSTPNFKK